MQAKIGAMTMRLSCARTRPCLFRKRRVFIILQSFPASGQLSSSSSAGRIGCEVSFWNVGSRAKLASYEPSYGASAIAYSPDGLSAAGGELYCGMVFLCTPPP